ncbi:hypothetical protein [Microbacterium sp. YY-01]|uniref:DUF7916 family protein n=1 Tax=Microbacterium sp. YY-01 TaxID=3421634 RepID=UPI003D16D920
MTLRLLDHSASDTAEISKQQLIHAIRASEGRTVLCEVAATTQPVLVSVSNAELVAAMSADIILVNLFDVHTPFIDGLPADTPPSEMIREIKRLTGRPVGINLEPVDEYHSPDGGSYFVPEGRRATRETAQLAADLGVDLIVLTGNPGAGVSNATIADALRSIRQQLGDTVVLAAGRMHAAGVFNAAHGIVEIDDVDAFASAGADMLLIPAPGTVPGVSLELANTLVTRAHKLGMLAMTTIGTSQEGADEQTMRQLALSAKMAGADVHHLGDAGYAGTAIPENILAYSIAVRGRRHTYTRMARSLNR